MELSDTFTNSVGSRITRCLRPRTSVLFVFFVVFLLFSLQAPAHAQGFEPRGFFGTISHIVDSIGNATGLNFIFSRLPQNLPTVVKGSPLNKRANAVRKLRDAVENLELELLVRQAQQGKTVDKKALSGAVKRVTDARDALVKVNEEAVAFYLATLDKQRKLAEEAEKKQGDSKRKYDNWRGQVVQEYRIKQEFQLTGLADGNGIVIKDFLCYPGLKDSMEKLLSEAEKLLPPSSSESASTSEISSQSSVKPVQVDSGSNNPFSE